MIRRETESGWIIIPQTDHAHLAADLASAWDTNERPYFVDRDWLIPAVRDHDDGWYEWERHPDIVPETGFPRDFTEMPPEESTAIWEHSIETCKRGRHSIVSSVEEFRRFLSQSGMRLTHERAMIAEEVFSSREAFSPEDVLHRLPARDDGKRVSRASVYRTLSLMEEARLLRKVSLGTETDAFEQTRLIGSGSILGGLAVSYHFRFLAQRSQENHSDPATKGFLEHQIAREKQWRAEWISEHLRSDPRQTRKQLSMQLVIDVRRGMRWVQFFDYLSLWLCCRERSTTESFQIPDSPETMHITPLKSGEFAVEPYTFSTPEVTLKVTGKRLLQKTFVSQEELANALESAEPAELTWKFVRW